VDHHPRQVQVGLLDLLVWVHLEHRRKHQLRLGLELFELIVKL
jgi:hypothetical protein